MTETVSARLQVKRLLHAQTNIEYARNGMKNERFRIVRLKGTPDSLRPNGWASNTLCYLFPEMYQHLFESLFDVRQTRSEKLESGDTISLQKSSRRNLGENYEFDSRLYFTFNQRLQQAFGIAPRLTFIKMCPQALDYCLTMDYLVTKAQQFERKVG
ncbi:hypothetical protein Ddc_15738 [Ditylenchus destructor]|nr:hypothetical protein Ddc_15738 [Ditylenchus destructor]